MTRLAVAASVFLFLLGCAASTEDARIRVVDGDTIALGGSRLRLFGIDAPEISQTCTRRRDGAVWACGTWAAAEVRRRYEGRRATCTPADRDRYGRTVAICRVEGQDMGAEIVSAGIALAYVSYSGRYLPEERAARAEGRGIFGSDFVPPWSFRAGPKSPPQVAPAGCPIKGNVSSIGRIYHMPWQASYDATRIDTSAGEHWFCSEAEARAAGWRRAKR